MGSLMLGGAILVAALLLFTAAAGRRASGSPSPSAKLLRMGGWLLSIGGALILVSSTVIVIEAGQVGVRHAFGEVAPLPLLSGVRIVTPWSNIERFSTREEQFPRQSTEAEQISALSAEQMGMQVDVAVRGQIDPMQAPHIFRELGGQEQIEQRGVDRSDRGRDAGAGCGGAEEESDAEVTQPTTSPCGSGRSVSGDHRIPPPAVPQRPRGGD
jgi:hypothetical protein